MSKCEAKKASTFRQTAPTSNKFHTHLANEKGPRISEQKKGNTCDIGPYLYGIATSTPIAPRIDELEPQSHTSVRQQHPNFAQYAPNPNPNALARYSKVASIAQQAIQLAHFQCSTSERFRDTPTRSRHIDSSSLATLLRTSDPWSWKCGSSRGVSPREFHRWWRHTRWRTEHRSAREADWGGPVPTGCRSLPTHCTKRVKLIAIMKYNVKKKKYK